MIGSREGRAVTAPPEDYVVFDLETTGLSPASDRIVEVAAIRVRGGCVDAEFQTLVNPEMRIPYGASRVNHITDEMVEDEPTIGPVMKAFDAFIGGDVLVGHNIGSFDLPFLQRAAREVWGGCLANSWFDTLPASRRWVTGIRRHGLGALAEYFGVNTMGAHRALQDCRMNMAVYERIAAEMRRAAEEGRTAPEDVKICPACGRPMVKRRGRYGEFFGCTGFPKCRHTEKIR